MSDVERRAPDPYDPRRDPHPFAWLSEAEVAELAECEAVIAPGLRTFIQVGNALLRVRDGRLYRAKYGSFEDYCRLHWGIGHNYANKQIVAAEVAGAVGTLVPIPGSESVARELVPLRREPGVVREAWVKAVERHGAHPTAEQVREVVETILRGRPVLDLRREPPARAPRAVRARETDELTAWCDLLVREALMQLTQPGRVAELAADLAPSHLRDRVASQAGSMLVSAQVYGDRIWARGGPWLVSDTGAWSAEWADAPERPAGIPPWSARGRPRTGRTRKPKTTPGW